MSSERPERRGPRPRPEKGRSRVGLLVKAALVLIVFALGVAFGQALEDSETDGSVTTYRRTFSVPDETVTVTVPG